MAERQPDNTPLRRSERTKTPVRPYKPYPTSRANPTSRREIHEKNPPTKKQQVETGNSSQLPTKPKAKSQVTVELPSPHPSRVNKSTKVSKGKEKAPTPVVPNGALGSTTETRPEPIYPGPRPQSGDELELELLTDEWKRQRLIWYLTFRDRKEVLPNRDYEDLKRDLGREDEWYSEDEEFDEEAIKRFTSKRVGSQPSMNPQIGRFDQEPPRRDPVPVHPLPTPPRATTESHAEGSRKSQATTNIGKNKRQHSEEPNNPSKRPRIDSSSKTKPSSKAPQKKIRKSGGLVILDQNGSQASKPSSRTASTTSSYPSTKTAPSLSSPNYDNQPPVQPSTRRELPAARPSTNRNHKESASVTTGKAKAGNAGKKTTQSQSSTPGVSSSAIPREAGNRVSNSGTTESASSRSGQPRATSDSRRGNTSRTSQPGGRNRARGNDVYESEESSEEIIDEDEEDGRGEHETVKKKVSSKGRARLKDFHGVEKSILKTAGYAYQALMLVQGMYETDVVILDKRRLKAWRMGCERYEADPDDFPLTDRHIECMVDRLVSWRGHAARKITDKVEYNFFNKKFDRCTPAQKEEFIKKLKEGHLHTTWKAPRGVGLFQGELMQVCMDRLVFEDRKSLGVQYLDLFREPSAQLLCFFCAIIEFICEKNRPEPPAKVKLDFDVQRKSYNTHLGSHRVWLKKNKSRWYMIQEQLFLRGFKHSKASINPVEGDVRFMLQDDDVEDDNPDAEEIAIWEAEMRELQSDALLPPPEGGSYDDGPGSDDVDGDEGHPPPEEEEVYEQEVTRTNNHRSDGSDDTGGEGGLSGTEDDTGEANRRAYNRENETLSDRYPTPRPSHDEPASDDGASDPEQHVQGEMEDDGEDDDE